MMSQFTYDAAAAQPKEAEPPRPFHVVHRNGAGKLTSSVSFHKNEELARTDAAARTTKAKDMELKCKYEVFPATEGRAVHKDDPVTKISS